MANNTKEIRRRIKSIGNTKKITKAMEMVSASKMRRAVASVLAIRPYAHSAWNVLTNLAREFESRNSGLLEVREVKSVLILIITSNKGLCGSFNSQIIKKVKQELKNPALLKINRVGNRKIKSQISDEDLKVDFITIGKKSEGIIRFLRKKILASFPDLTYLPNMESVRAVTKIVMEEYLNKNYDKIVIAYTDYISTINQQPKIRQILPISKIDIEKQMAEMDDTAKEYGLEETKLEYKIEPNPKEMLDFIFPRLIEMQIYHAILESNASKESARMMAMRNATEAAGEMVEDLTLAYNQLRQTKITQEIAEISAGSAVLKG